MRCFRLQQTYSKKQLKTKGGVAFTSYAKFRTFNAGKPSSSSLGLGPVPKWQIELAHQITTTVGVQ